MSDLPAAAERAGERAAGDPTSRTGVRRQVDATEQDVGADVTSSALPVRNPEAGTTALLTAAQLAERWQVPVRTVYAWARRNAVPHYRAGRLLRFDPVAVEEHFRRDGFADEIEPDADRPGESAFNLLTA